MGSIGAFVEITIIFALVCASAMICILQASTIKPTYNIYVVDLEPKFRSFEVESMLESAGDKPEDALSHLSGAEFEDSDLNADVLFDSQLQSFDDTDNYHEGTISVLCWLATETTYTQDSDHAMMKWRAPCYREMQLSEKPLIQKSECHFEVLKNGELMISFSDAEIAFRSNINVSGVEYMVFSKKKDILLVDEDHKTLWSSEDNKVFNCIE